MAEVHGKISQILQNNHIIQCCQFTDNPQFFFFQANPAGIIGI
nr:MAG: hypothetical protein [Bacteriophage sp.]